MVGTERSAGERAGRPAGHGVYPFRNVTVKFPLRHWEQLREWAETSGKPVTRLVRELSMGRLSTASQHAPLIRALGRCGTRLSELTAAARASGASAEARQLELVLAELLALVRQLAPGGKISEPAR